MKKMKSFLKVTALLIVASLVMVSMNYCKKDVGEQIQQDKFINNSYKTGAIMAERDSIFVIKMIEFDSIISEYVKNSAHSTSLTMDSKEAIWQTKAYINIKHNYSDTKYGNVESFKTTVDIPLANDSTVNIDDIYLLYDKCYDSLISWHAQSKFNNRGLVAVNITEVQKTITNITVEVKAVFGQPVSFNYGNPFGVDDDWRWGNVEGKCDNSNPGYDASDKIEEALNSNHLDPICPATGYIIKYIPEESIVLEGNEYRTPHDDLDNYLDYLMFYNTDEGNLEIRHDFEECLEDVEMNFYYQGESEIVYEKLIEENPDLGWFISGELDYVDENINNNRVIHHKNTLTFGSWYVIKDNSVVFDLEILD